MRKLYNSLLNVFWTVLAFVPVFLIWWEAGVSFYFWTLLGIALALGFVPVGFFRLSIRRRFYEKWGVKWIRKWVQDGDWVKGKGEAVGEVQALQRYGKKMSMYELFHWQCFLFFLGTAVLGLFRQDYLLAGATLLANHLYNFMAILLQQYNRLRLAKWL